MAFSRPFVGPPYDVEAVEFQDDSLAFTTPLPVEIRAMHQRVVPMWLFPAPSDRQRYDVYLSNHSPANLLFELRRDLSFVQYVFLRALYGDTEAFDKVSSFELDVCARAAPLLRVRAPVQFEATFPTMSAPRTCVLGSTKIGVFDSRLSWACAMSDYVRNHLYVFNVESESLSVIELISKAIHVGFTDGKPVMSGLEHRHVCRRAFEMTRAHANRLELLLTFQHLSWQSAQGSCELLSDFMAMIDPTYAQHLLRVPRMDRPYARRDFPDLLHTLDFHSNQMTSITGRWPLTGPTRNYGVLVGLLTPDALVRSVREAVVFDSMSKASMKWVLVSLQSHRGTSLGRALAETVIRNIYGLRSPGSKKHFNGQSWPAAFGELTDNPNRLLATVMVYTNGTFGAVSDVVRLASLMVSFDLGPVAISTKSYKLSGVTVPSGQRPLSERIEWACRVFCQLNGSYSSTIVLEPFRKRARALTDAIGSARRMGLPVGDLELQLSMNQSWITRGQPPTDVSLFWSSQCEYGRQMPTTGPNGFVVSPQTARLCQVALPLTGMLEAAMNLPRFRVRCPITFKLCEPLKLWKFNFEGTGTASGFRRWPLLYRMVVFSVMMCGQRAQLPNEVMRIILNLYDNGWIVGNFGV